MHSLLYGIMFMVLVKTSVDRLQANPELLLNLFVISRIWYYLTSFTAVKSYILYEFYFVTGQMKN